MGQETQDSNEVMKKNRFKLYVLFAVLVGGTGLGIFLLSDRSPAPEKETPRDSEQYSGRIVFDSPSYDFGRQIPGRKLKHQFSFKNEGDQPLKILWITTNCGCAAAVASGRIIPPGGQGRIDASLLTGKVVGRKKLEKQITVCSSDPESEKTKLTLIVDIVEPMACEPRSLDLGKVLAGKTIEKTLILRSRSAGPFRLESAESTVPNFHVRSDPPMPADVPAGGTVKLIVKATPTEKDDSLYGHLLLKIGGGIDYQMKIPVEGRIVGIIDCDPRAVFLGVIKKPGLKRTITLRHMGGRAFRVQPTRSPDWLRISVSPGARAAVQKLCIEVIALPPEGFIQNSLSLTTDEKALPRIALKIYGLRR